MSPPDASRFTDAMPHPRSAELSTPSPAVEDYTPVLNDTVGEGAAGWDPWSARPISHARVGPSQKARSRAYNDPSNYLG